MTETRQQAIARITEAHDEDNGTWALGHLDAWRIATPRK